MRRNLLILFLLGILVNLAIAQLDSVGDSYGDAEGDSEGDSVGDAEGDSYTVVNDKSCIADFEGKCTSLNQCCSFNCQNGECQPGIIFNSIIHKFKIDLINFSRYKTKLENLEKMGA